VGARGSFFSLLELTLLLWDARTGYGFVDFSLKIQKADGVLSA
jgi:hypothetical protein